MEEKGLRLVDYFDDTGDTLEEKMRKSKSFIVVINKRYIRELKTNEKSIVEPACVAKKLRKDTILIIDKNLSKDDMRLLESHLVDLNVVRREYVDTSNRALVARIIVEVYSVYNVGDRDEDSSEDN